jgi:hypothetical protein
MGKPAFPIVESSSQHIFGWFAVATVALRSDHESLDLAEMYVEASTELKRCVLDRVGPPNRRAWPVSHQPRRAHGSRAATGRNYVALASPDPPATACTFGRGQHSSARNIGRQAIVSAEVSGLWIRAEACGLAAEDRRPAGDR